MEERIDTYIQIKAIIALANNAEIYSGFHSCRNPLISRFKRVVTVLIRISRRSWVLELDFVFSSTCTMDDIDNIIDLNENRRRWWI